MQRMTSLLLFTIICFSSETANFSKEGVNHFSSAQQQMFEEGKAWAKGGTYQDTQEKTPNQPAPEDLQHEKAFEEEISKCMKGVNASFESPSLSNKLFIFISFSIPEETLKELSYGLEKIGGSFLIKGLPQNSFRAFFEKSKALKEKGIFAPIVIDPEAFEDFHIEKVPTFVLKNETAFEKYEGNIPLYDALKIFAQRKPVRKRAAELLHKLTWHHQQNDPNQEDETSTSWKPQTGWFQ
ncbi:MAG: type-F conjugative transfer system pilin assembly protein TrbC [Chlamydiia bacterium]|nr:type-F conjugative transfer system pilin assembly protein TrbC [Chlamydiia bacterium]